MKNLIISKNELTQINCRCHIVMEINIFCNSLTIKQKHGTDTSYKCRAILATLRHSGHLRTPQSMR